MRLHTFRAILVTVAVAPAGAFLSQSASAQAPPTVFVIDGSGSMWGNLGAEKQSKFDLARAAIRQSLTSSALDARIGLVAFGHRRRGDCSDVEAVALPDPGPPERVLSLIDKLNPKGKGPLAQSLRESAKLVPAGSPGTVVLIHDGPDNCGQDPCAAASEIAKANPRIAIHVLALGPEADAQRMSCVAKTTRGRMFEASDAPALQAAVAEIVKIAKLDQSSPSALAEPSGEVSESAAPASGPPGLRLSASLASNGTALAVPVAWKISKEGGETVLDRTAPEIAEPLPPGKYAVSARYGAVTASQTVEVADGPPTVARIALNAGTLKISARANKNLEALAQPIISVFSAPSADPPQPARPVWLGRDPDAEIVVPAGDYTIKAEDGMASREANVTVAAGSRTETPLIVGTGRLELEAVVNEGGEILEDVTFTISEDDPDAPQGRREIIRSADPHATFTLPAGTYYVAALHGSTEARERIAIGTGDTVKKTLALNLGRLSVSALLNGETPPADHAVTFRALRLEPEPREIARSSSAAPLFLLPQGRYRVEARAGIVKKAETETEVQAGKDFKVVLSLDELGAAPQPAPTPPTLRQPRRQQ